MNASHAPAEELGLTTAISRAMEELYAAFYRHDRTTATTYINDKIVVCVLENIPTDGETVLVADGARGGGNRRPSRVSDRDRGRVHRRNRAVD